eukprot:6420753-Alexandrium_andersonii.AAC.1
MAGAAVRHLRTESKRTGAKQPPQAQTLGMPSTGKALGRRCGRIAPARSRTALRISTGPASHGRTRASKHRSRAGAGSGAHALELLKLLDHLQLVDDARSIPERALEDHDAGIQG